MLISEHHGTIQVVGGTGYATIHVLVGVMQQVIIIPTTAGNVYDFSVINSKNFIVIDGVDRVGEFNNACLLPLRDNATLQITGANIDEEFSYYISINES